MSTTTTEKRCTCTGPLYPKEARVDRHIDPACPWHGQWAHLFNKQLPRYDDDAPLPDPPPPTREDVLEAEIARLKRERDMECITCMGEVQTANEQANELEAEHKRLRTALEQYADKSNWVYRNYWVGEGDNPWDVAREALK